MMQSAMAAQAAGRYFEAEDLCKQILTISPRHVQATLLMGVIAAKTDQFQAAMEKFQQVLELSFWKTRKTGVIMFSFVGLTSCAI